MMSRSTQGGILPNLIFAYGRRVQDCAAAQRRECWSGEETFMRVGIAGLGRMGAAMAARLIEVGHEVTVWNRSADKAKPTVDAGGKLAATPAALASAVETVITCLTDADAIDRVYGGASGLLAGDLKGKLVIEMSTVRPGVQTALAEKVRHKGAAFVECPVGGSTGPARQGKLIGLMGAEPADAARAKPLLDQLCRRLEHVGPVGAGEVMKFTINMPLMIYWQALGEALALSRPLDLDPDRVMELLSDTSGGPNVLKVRGATVAKQLKGVDAGAVTFDVDSGLKDLRAMLAEGRARGVELPLVERSIACYEYASRHGLGPTEVSAVSAYWAARKAP
jgi:3-hydroxyisobutyrate dehydrogenase